MRQDPDLLVGFIIPDERRQCLLWLQLHSVLERVSAVDLSVVDLVFRLRSVLHASHKNLLVLAHSHVDSVVLKRKLARALCFWINFCFRIELPVRKIDEELLLSKLTRRVHSLGQEMRRGGASDEKFGLSEEVFGQKRRIIKNYLHF